MFGHVRPNMDLLDNEEKKRYRAAYCGLCHALGEKYGLASRLSLTYDLTFLSILLSSLYEPDERQSYGRCVLHPVKKHDTVFTQYTSYAADITVILAWHKCLDDWKDDKDILGLGYSKLLSDAYRKVAADRRELCEFVKKEMLSVSAAETEGVRDISRCANACGRIVAAIFAPGDDIWTPYLRNIGYSVGRFIYIADAFCDMPRDRKNKSYNPLLYSENSAETVRNMLEVILGEAAEAFELLPLERDGKIIKNIFYSGIWTEFDKAVRKEREKQKNDK